MLRGLGCHGNFSKFVAPSSLFGNINGITFATNEQKPKEEEILAEVISPQPQPIQPVAQPTILDFDQRKNSAFDGKSILVSPLSNKSVQKRTRRQERFEADKSPRDVSSESVPPKLDVKLKRKMVDWLTEINLLRKNSVTLEEFPQYCRNGVIFFDIINRLNGRSPVLKGLDRKPKSITGILTNFNKILDFLRKLEKFNSRFLWSHQQLMDGNTDVVYGLL